MLNLIRCEFWKLKRKMFVQLVLAASFLFPIPLTAIIYYLNTAQNKYATKAAAFDALWQSVIGFGMLLLLPCILGIVAALLFFMERDNDTFKNLRTIPITSSQMVIAKCIVLLLLSIAFCISSTVASILCGFVFFGVTDILFKVLFSAIYGLLIAISALPLILLIIFFSRSYIFSIMLCVFYSVFNLLSTFSMTALPKWLVLTLPTPSIMLWGTQQMSSRTAINDTEDLQNFIQIPALTGLVQMALLGFFLYLTMLPIIVLTSRYKGSFLVGVIVAFVYGFIGMFANGTLQSIYPVSAALGLINYRAGAEGVMWNKGLCFISILIMCAIGIALMFVKQKPEKREAKKTQHTAPKKGW